MDLPNGVYRGRAVGAALGETAKGAEQVAVAFVLLDFDSTRMTYFGTFGENAFVHTMKALRTAGWQGDDLADLASLSRDDTPEVDLVIENETYEGKTAPKIRWVNPRGIAMRAPLTADKAKLFAARMRGQVLAFNQANPTKPATNGRAAPRAPEPPPHMDSDKPPF